MSDHHPVHIAALCVGALAGVGHFLTMAEPILGSLSYIAAIAVAIVSIIYKIKAGK